MTKASPGTTKSPSSAERVTVVADTREQEPYAFDPDAVAVVRRALPAGDYSLPGYETSIAVERKTLADYVSSVIRGRDRFLRELGAGRVRPRLRRGRGLLEDITAHRYRSDASPSAVLGATVSILVDHGVPVFFCGDRQHACRFAEGLLCRYQRKVHR